MLKRSIFLLIPFLLFSCENTVEVDPRDASKAEAWYTLVDASNLDARYTDRSQESISAALDSTRTFIVDPKRDAKHIQLLLTGKDAESGIKQINSSLSITFKCNLSAGEFATANPPTRTVSINGTPYVRTSSEPAYEKRVVLVEFTYEDLWRQGGCSDLGFNAGPISDVNIRYTGTVYNNSGVTTEPQSINGVFTSKDLYTQL